jgi:hypothetical protein
MLQHAIRVVAFALGVVIFLGGLVAISAGGAAAISGVEAVVVGTIMMVASLIQRSGYRSEAAERSHAAPGPGGGEDGYIEPRFAPTTEVFVDPASKVLMRVYEDPRTGERRYRAEG